MLIRAIAVQHVRQTAVRSSRRDLDERRLLREGRSVLAAGPVLAVLHGIWHLALFGLEYTRDNVIPRMLTLTAYDVITAGLYTRTAGSLPRPAPKCLFLPPFQGNDAIRLYWISAALSWVAVMIPFARLRGRLGTFRAAALVALIAAMWTAGCARPASTIRQEGSRMVATSRDGTPIAYRRSGSGPPLVLVHGTTADHTRWAGVLPSLERHFTVYAMDRRGRGGSGDADGYAIEREFEDVAAVIEAIGEPVFLLGHSYGAVCSLEASRLTDKVRRLILYEPPIPTIHPLYPPGVPDRIQALVDAGDPEAGLELFFREVVRMPDGEFERYRALPVWKVRVTLAPTIPRELAIDRRYRFRPERFSGFAIPTLLLVGGESPPVFREATDMLAATLPDSRVAVMPGQRHVAMDTAPELFLAEVGKFLGVP